MSKSILYYIQMFLVAQIYVKTRKVLIQFGILTLFHQARVLFSRVLVPGDK